MSENFMPGRYLGKIYACDSGAVGANQTPVVKVYFKLNVSDRVVPWSGWLSDKVNEKTGLTYTELVIDKLLELGFTGTCLSEMSEKTADVPSLFNCEKDWELDIDYQTDRDGNATQYLQVNWINDPEKSINSKLDHEKAVQVFSGLNIKGAIAHRRAVNKIEHKPAPKSYPSHDDIPF